MNSLAGKRILIIDDDPAIQNVVQMLLARIGCETVAAGTANDGAVVLRQHPLPDLVLLDLMLPDVDGLELLRQMRAKATFDALPVVILSALADPEQIRRGLELGADRYITKPYLAANLTQTVTEVLRMGRRQAV
jgi:DNA-binding response OmpR family regulator